MLKRELEAQNAELQNEIAKLTRRLDKLSAKPVAAKASASKTPKNRSKRGGSGSHINSYKLSKACREAGMRVPTLARQFIQGTPDEFTTTSGAKWAYDGGNTIKVKAWDGRKVKLSI